MKLFLYVGSVAILSACAYTEPQEHWSGSSYGQVYNSSCGAEHYAVIPKAVSPCATQHAPSAYTPQDCVSRCSSSYTAQSYVPPTYKTPSSYSASNCISPCNESQAKHTYGVTSYRSHPKQAYRGSYQSPHQEDVVNGHPHYPIHPGVKSHIGTSHYHAHASHGNYGQYGTSHYPVLRGAKQAYHPRGRRGYFYGELGANYTYNIEDVGFLGGVQGRLGVQTPYFVGAEIEASKGLIGSGVDSVIFPSGIEDAKYSSDYSIGAFALARIPVRNGNIILRGGYHDTNFKVKSKESDEEFDVGNDGIAFGAGYELPIDQNSAIRSDFTAYDLGDDGYVHVSSLTYQRKF